MGANIAGIYGAQIFRLDDRPRYRRAFGICIGVLAAGIALAVIRYLYDVLRRCKNKDQVQDAVPETTALEDEFDGKTIMEEAGQMPVPDAPPAGGRRLSSYGAAV